jgi:hypothetical protein
MDGVGIYGFDMVYRKNRGEREIWMEPVHEIDDKRNVPGEFLGFDVIDTGLDEDSEWVNPVALERGWSTALRAVGFLIDCHDAILPGEVYEQNKRRQYDGPVHYGVRCDPETDDRLTTRRPGTDYSLEEMETSLDWHGEDEIFQHEPGHAGGEDDDGTIIETNDTWEHIISEEIPTPRVILTTIARITETGDSGWSMFGDERRADFGEHESNRYAREFVFKAHERDRQIRIEPVHLRDANGGLPGTQVGYDVVDTGYPAHGGRHTNPVAKGVDWSTAFETATALLMRTEESIPEEVEEDNRRRQRLETNETDPEAPDELTTRRDGIDRTID